MCCLFILLMLLLLVGCILFGLLFGGSIVQFQKIDIQFGIGVEVMFGSCISVYYIGWIYDECIVDKYGEKFDSLVDCGEFFSFMFGKGEVIKGWDEGFVGMKVGGKWMLMILVEYGYGVCCVGLIVLGFLLVFDVELFDVILC